MSSYNLRVRKCPKCLPDVAGAYFERTYEAPNEWACRNCSTRVVLRPRAGADRRQTEAVEAVRAALHPSIFKVTENDKLGASRCFTAVPLRWFDVGLLIYVGPRGSVEAIDLDSKGERRHGRAALRWLSIVGQPSAPVPQ